MKRERRSSARIKVGETAEAPFSEAAPSLAHESHEGHSHPQPRPIAERTGADPRFTGRGVVAAFLDSGFYLHPDLTTPFSRIHAYENLVGGPSGVDALAQGDASSWHGMMSSVVAAGNGALSGGRYKSLAPDMALVLAKIGTLSRVHHDDIARGIEWVLLHRARYDIRILNISAGGDYEASYLDDILSRFAEAAIRAGIVVVAAVGNHGERPGYVVPPASVPAVITVGGLDDGGDPRLGRLAGYHSSYGPTIDGLQKPEVITLADWLPAPILPGTPTAEQATLLTTLERTPDEKLAEVIAANHGVLPPLDECRNSPAYLIRHFVASALRDGNVIDEHYKMVDGTSFAAPIVTSVVAQMLEANPALRPQEVKRILIQTALRLPNLEVVRQGWGVVQPAAAVARALEMRAAK